MPLTLAAVLLRILSNPLANVCQKRLTNGGQHPLLVNFATFFLLGTACLLVVPGIEWKELPAAFWCYSLIAGAFGAVGNGFLVKALQRGELSVLGPINAYKSVVGVITGIFLLGEKPDLRGAAGIALIIGGSYFVLDTTDERFSAALLRRRDIQYRIWAMILTAIEAVFIKKVILYSSVGISFVAWCWSSALFSWLLLGAFGIRPGKALRSTGAGDRARYVLLALCVGTMQYTTNYVFDRMNVGYALALFQLSILVSILLGYRLFSERHIGKKLLGAVIMIAGSALIVLCK